MNFKLVGVEGRETFWESEWDTCVSGPVAGLYVTRVISIVTDQHGTSDGSTLRALGSHEKVDSHGR